MSMAVTLPKGPTVAQSHSAMLPLPLPSSRHCQPWSPGIQDLRHQVEPFVLDRRGLIEYVRFHSIPCYRSNGLLPLVTE
jgi:hypothetical protein